MADALRDAVRADKLVAPDRLVDYLGPVAKRRGTAGRALADNLFELAGLRPEGWTVAETETEETDGYGDWRSLELPLPRNG